MIIKKRYLPRPCVVIILTVLMGFTLSCHPRFHRFHHKAPDSQKFAERILKRMDKQVDLLDLTSTQKETYNSIRAKVKRDLVTSWEERRAFFRTVKTEINLDNPDMDRLSELAKEHLRRFPEAMAVFLDYFVEFYQVLNEEQQNQIIQKMRDKIDRFPS